MGRIEIDKQKGPFSFSTDLGPEGFWSLEISAPLFGEKNAVFDLKTEQLLGEESNFIRNLSTNEGITNTNAQIQLASVFKKILYQLKNPNCENQKPLCTIREDKIVMSQEILDADLHNRYQAEIELIGQSEKNFQRVIITLTEGQDGTEFHKLKLIMKVQSCDIVRKL